MEMTLRSYYDSLPAPVAPKTAFINKIAVMCGVNTATVRQWVKGRAFPSDPNHYAVLARETGIESEKLFDR